MSHSIEQIIRKKVNSYRKTLTAGVCLFYMMACVLAGMLAMALAMGILSDWLMLFKNRWTAGMVGVLSLMAMTKGFFPLGLWRRIMAFLDNETCTYESALWRAARCMPGYYR